MTQSRQNLRPAEHHVCWNSGAGGGGLGGGGGEARAGAAEAARTVGAPKSATRAANVRLALRGCSAARRSAAASPGVSVAVIVALPPAPAVTFLGRRSAGASETEAVTTMDPDTMSVMDTAEGSADDAAEMASRKEELKEEKRDGEAAS